MNDKFIIILLVLAAAMLVLGIAKLIPFLRRFGEDTRLICYAMDRADSYKEYRKRRNELRCHYLMLIPFVNKKNVMYVYRLVFRKGDHAKKKERKDSFVPLLLPSVLGVCICMVCICSMTWAWYSAGVQTSAQKITAAYYAVHVASVTQSDGTEIIPSNESYALEQDNTYTVQLQASGSVKECGGYCLIEIPGTETKLYTKIIKPGETLTITLPVTVSGSYTFVGVWGSHPAGTAASAIISDTSIGKVSAAVSSNGTSSIAPNVTKPAPAESSASAAGVSSPLNGTYTVQSGDTLKDIAKKCNTTAEKLAAYNKITDVSVVKAGQVLKIPPQDYVIPKPTESNQSTPAVIEPSSMPTASIIDSATPSTNDTSAVQQTTESVPAMSMVEDSTPKEIE